MEFIATASIKSTLSLLGRLLIEPKIKQYFLREKNINKRLLLSVEYSLKRQMKISDYSIQENLRKALEIIRDNPSMLNDLINIDNPLDIMTNYNTQRRIANKLGVELDQVGDSAILGAQIGQALVNFYLEECSILLDSKQLDQLTLKNLGLLVRGHENFVQHFDEYVRDNQFHHKITHEKLDDIKNLNEEEQFITRYQNSIDSFESIIDALYYANLLIGMDYRYIKNQSKFDKMRQRDFKEIANYYNIDSDKYWNSTHSHFYISHKDFKQATYLHSENFLAKNDFEYRLKYYRKIIKEVFEDCVYTKTISVINTVLTDKRGLFVTLVTYLVKFRNKLKEIYILSDNFEINKLLRKRNNYKKFLEKKENGTLNDHDIRTYELISLVDLESMYPSKNELSREHMLELETEIINHYQDLLRKLNSVFLEMGQINQYYNEVQEKATKISNMYRN